MLKSSAVDQVIIDSQKTHREQAYDIMDHHIGAKDAITGLLPLHVKTDAGKLVAVDHTASGLDMGRTTTGLVMLSQLAASDGDTARAEKYLNAARQNYERGKELLAKQDYIVHQINFDDQGKQTTPNLGEPGKSAHGQDNMSRVNPRAYAFRAAAELYLATNQESYRRDFERYFHAWIRDFHDPTNGGFFIHANLMDASDHSEMGPFKDPGGVDSSYDGLRGVKGNDGTIYALSSVLLQANDVLANEQTQNLVKEQLDIIVGRLRRQNGMLWENYASDWKPISVDWQNRPMDAPEGHRTSHVAIGGHTAMAPQQILEGARQLLRQKRISKADYASYIDQALSLFQDFATNSSAIDWGTGAVHNGIRIEEPRTEHRVLWSDAGWQQAELIQTLLRFREEDRLKDIKGPDGRAGEELLVLAEGHYIKEYPLPMDYSFTDFGNPDVYHRPQLALYHHEVISQLGR